MYIYTRVYIYMIWCIDRIITDLALMWPTQFEGFFELKLDIAKMVDVWGNVWTSEATMTSGHCGTLQTGNQLDGAVCDRRSERERERESCFFSRQCPVSMSKQKNPALQGQRFLKNNANCSSSLPMISMKAMKASAALLRFQVSIQKPSFPETPCTSASWNFEAGRHGVKISIINWLLQTTTRHFAIYGDIIYKPA